MNCARCRVSWELCAENKVFLTLNPRYLKGLSVRPYVRARDFHGRAKKHGERQLSVDCGSSPSNLTERFGVPESPSYILCALNCPGGTL